MPLLKTSSPELAQAAALRAERADVGSTAIWHYAAQNPIAKILMIHGFRGNHLGLSPQCGSLVDYQIAIPDLPGYGQSRAFAETHDLDHYGKWLKTLVEQLGEDWIVLGHSFGSLVVSNALSQGMRCRAVVLQNPITTRASDQATLGNRLADFFYSATAKMGNTGSALLRSAVIVRLMSIAMATTKNLKLRSWIHDQHHRHFSNYREDRVAFEGYRAAAQGNVMDYAKSFDVPVLMIAGESDVIAPLANQVLAQQQIASAELRVIPNVGHLTHYESPVAVASAIDEFVGHL